MTISIVCVDPSSAHLLGKVAEDVFDFEIKPELLAPYLDDPNHFLCIAMQGDLVVGQMRAIVHLQPDRKTEFYIDNAGVAPAFRRRGIASQLYRELTRIAIERNCSQIWVGAESDEKPARSFYRALGLKEKTMVYFDGKL